MYKIHHELTSATTYTANSMIVLMLETTKGDQALLTMYQYSLVGMDFYVLVEYCTMKVNVNRCL